MDGLTSHFQSKYLEKAKSLDDFMLYRAALEWDLIDPIVIEDRKDLKSEYKWKENIEPYHHQVTNLISFCRRLPVTLIADDVGLGKTISAGLIISELISRNRIAKVLIVCPKLLLPQWKEELETKFSISSVIAKGKELIEAEPPNSIGAVITTYHSARLYLTKIADSGYDMLILDEAHKLRNLYGVDPTPQVATRFRDALENRQFKYVLMLTATPIQNRLWDLYSLVDLLTVARGHQNPFGSEGVFARKFIADNRTQARHLNPDAKDEFRSIIYGYMSRVRRADANLHFPERHVQLHTVPPTPTELKLIETVAAPIQKLNRLAQISILQALISSPHALAAQLNNMARNKTVPQSLAADVQEIVKNITTTAKLDGLGKLVDKLRSENPIHWRMVVFTGRRETQTSIQAFLEERGIRCGVINGDSGQRNQDTIGRMKNVPPEIHVIISTEAGSEGVNLQAANVLVNYDLPWNPMIVEQRIGRIQRLASQHANVAIFNTVLKGTFEEYIVGRLMEKLQMASHAIGDIEALLEASGMDDADDNGATSFEEMIRQLVMQSLDGKNVEEATRLAEQSISEAKIELEREEKNIDSMLGGMGDPDSGQPRSPKLPDQVRSMDPKSFVLAALQHTGAKLTPRASDTYASERDGRFELICFEEQPDYGGTYILYRPGSPAFSRLVSQITSDNLHIVEDSDLDPVQNAKEIAKTWVTSFGGAYTDLQIKDAWRCFKGNALVRVRSTVAHDSYERLVEVDCNPEEHRSNQQRHRLEKISADIQSPSDVGVNTDLITESAKLELGIKEFCRFYTERLQNELKSAGNDSRKRKKLEDDFTPRIEVELVGLEGHVYREIVVHPTYRFKTSRSYSSELIVVPSKGIVRRSPQMGTCSISGQQAPIGCLEKCEITNQLVLRDNLVQSEVSGRLAIPEHTSKCSVTGKTALLDELEKSSVTGNLVIRNLLKTSALSGKKAEPEYFGQCEFTQSSLLENELAISQISGKRYRVDQQLCSVVSGRFGHKKEFIFCSQTNQPLIREEAERCDVTGKLVIPGILENCEVSGKKVLPIELEKSSVSGKRALKKYFISSNVSGTRLLEQEAIKSLMGNYCAPVEAKACMWSGRLCHPEDLKTCELSGVSVYLEYIKTKNDHSHLEYLIDLLDGITRKTDSLDIWDRVSISASSVLGKKKCKVVNAISSHDKRNLAVLLEVRSLLGMKLRFAGLLYSIPDGTIIGRVSVGKRDAKGWIPD